MAPPNGGAAAPSTPPATPTATPTSSQPSPTGFVLRPKVLCCDPPVVLHNRHSPERASRELSRDRTVTIRTSRVRSLTWRFQGGGTGVGTG